MTVRGVVALPLLALLLAACSGEPESGPSSLPKISTAPSVSPSASSPEVAMPSEAAAATPQGAAAFARYYLQVLHEAFETAETRPLAAISHPECSTCQNFIRITQADQLKALRFQGGDYEVLSAEATQSAPGDALVDVLYNRSASVTRDADGAVVSRGAPQDRVLMQMRTVRSTDGWIARGIRYPKAPS